MLSVCPPLKPDHLFFSFRIGKVGNQKRVVGVLLGSWQKKVLDVSNSFAGKVLHGWDVVLLIENEHFLLQPKDLISELLFEPNGYTLDQEVSIFNSLCPLQLLISWSARTAPDCVNIGVWLHLGISLRDSLSALTLNI